jgi:hypothetical protein
MNGQRNSGCEKSVEGRLVLPEFRSIHPVATPRVTPNE